MADQFTKAQFEWLNQVAADASLPHSAFKLAYLISRHINRQSGKAWPSQATLAAAAGLTPRSVRDLTERLVNAGHLQVDTHRGRHQTNVYRLAKNRKPASAIDGAADAIKEEGSFPIGCDQNRKLEVEKEEDSRKKSGSQIPTNPLRNPYKNPERNDLGRKGSWSVGCESQAGLAWQRYWSDNQLPPAPRSGRTDTYFGLPSEFPP